MYTHIHIIISILTHILLQPSNTIREYIFWAFGGIVITGLTGIGVWYTIRKGAKAEKREQAQAATDQIAPFKSAAEGWKVKCDELSETLSDQDNEIKNLKHQLRLAERTTRENKLAYDNLEMEYINISRNNQRQQGEINELKKKVDEIVSIKEVVQGVLADIKDTTSG